MVSGGMLLLGSAAGFLVFEKKVFGEFGGVFSRCLLPNLCCYFVFLGGRGVWVFSEGTYPRTCVAILFLFLFFFGEEKG